MSLLIQENDTFEIEVRYVKNNSIFKIFGPNENVEGAIVEKFTFKRPNWTEAQRLMSACVLVDATNGRAILDPYRYMDLKVKSLLRDWTLMDNEEKLAPTPENVNKLDPSIIQYLFQRMNDVLEPEESKE